MHPYSYCMFDYALGFWDCVSIWKMAVKMVILFADLPYTSNIFDFERFKALALSD